jgi:hypothetical protein
VSREIPPPIDVFGLDAWVEPGLARYRPILPDHALGHFRRVATFLLETHPAASRWIVQLRNAGGTGAAPTDKPVARDVISSLAAVMGLRPPAIAEVEDRAEVVVHGAEAGLGFLVEASFPACATPEELRLALGRFVDHALASLFAGLIGCLINLHEKNPESDEHARVLSHFVWAFALFRRFDLPGRHPQTFDWYFGRPIPGRSATVAKHLKRPIAEEKAEVFRFLDELAAFVAREAPRMEREVKTDSAELTRHSRPWAMTLMSHELLPPPRASKRRRGS